MNFEINFKNFCFVMLCLFGGLGLLLVVPWYAQIHQQPKISLEQLTPQHPQYYFIKYRTNGYHGYLNETCDKNLMSCPSIEGKDSPIILNDKGIIITTKPQAGPPYFIIGEFNSWLGGGRAQEDGSWVDYFNPIFFISTTDDGYPIIERDSWLFLLVTIPDTLWMVASMTLTENGEYQWHGYGNFEGDHWGNGGITGPCMPYTYIPSYGGNAFLMNPGSFYKRDTCW